jgi:hypothetical protein
MSTVLPEVPGLTAFARDDRGVFEPVWHDMRITGMKPFHIAVAVVAILGAAAVAVSQSTAAETAEPVFALVEQAGSFEIRDYAPHVVAEVIVPAGLGGGMNAGFRPLADYIFGNNRMDAGSPRDIAMTAPVTGQRVAREIAMTAPVTGQTTGAGQSRVRFIMPAGETLDTLPRPNNPAVRLIAEPARRYAVVRFSGLANDGAIARHTGELRAFMAGRNMTGTGEPVTAFYDPPWTLPFNRRNEIWIEVSPGRSD